MRPVWVIDDDRSIRWVFEKALAREGIPFKTFAQATEAMDALDSSGAPQVLVSDIRMPARRVSICSRTSSGVSRTCR